MSCCQIRLLLSCSFGARKPKKTSFRRDLSPSYLSPKHSDDPYTHKSSREANPPDYSLLSHPQLSISPPNIFTASSSLTPRNSTYPFIDPSRQTDKLRNKTVLITGADRGLGRETALSFANAGACVICIGRRQTDIDAVTAEINSKHPTAPSGLAISSNVGDPGSADAVLSTLREKLGNDAGVDILVANAGMTPCRSFEMEPDARFDDWWHVLEVNLRSTVSFIRAVLPRMRARGSGVVISLASGSGSQDTPSASAYAAFDAAIIKFNQDLGLELQGSGVQCFVVHPGTVATALASAAGIFEFEAEKNELRMQEVPKEFQNMEMQTPDLAANTIVALCTEERAKCMSGRYVDSQQDLEEVLKDAGNGPESRIVKEKLNCLKIEEL